MTRIRKTQYGAGLKDIAHSILEKLYVAAPAQFEGEHHAYDIIQRKPYNFLGQFWA